MATVRDLIKGSMRLIGAIATGETPTADEQADGLVALNDMLDSWSAEGLKVFERVREEFTLTPGTASYTIGTGGTFNTTRPIEIQQATIEDQSVSPTVEVPVSIIGVQEWAGIRVKDLQATFPQKLYPSGAFPLDVLSLYPVPSVANKLVLYSLKPLTAFASAASTVSLPPGYAKALRYNLALELAPEFGKPVDAAVAIQATEAKANVERANIQPVYLSCDPGVLPPVGGFNILTGG